MMEGIALSVRQPWASMIVWGLKTVEVRSWVTDYRGPVFVHAAKARDDYAIQRFELGDLPSGCLIGTVELVDVELFDSSSWDRIADAHLQIGPFRPGLYAWHLANPKPLPKPVPYRGGLGLFHISIEDACTLPEH